MSTTRRSMLAAAGPVFASAALLNTTAGAAASRGDPVSDPDVAALILRATRAHQALMRGDIEGYRAQFKLADDFTLMAPFGGPPSRGGHYSDERWASIGRFFRNGKHSTLTPVEAYRSADMVVLAVIERTHAEIGGLPPQPWSLRVTMVFRKEEGGWLLAHRHADPLVPGVSVQQAAALALERAS